MESRVRPTALLSIANGGLAARPCAATGAVSGDGGTLEALERVASGLGQRPSAGRLV